MGGVMFWLLALPLRKQCFLFPALLFLFPLLFCLGRTEATSHFTPLLLERRPVNLLVSHIGSMLVGFTCNLQFSLYLYNMKGWIWNNLTGKRVIFGGLEGEVAGMFYLSKISLLVSHIGSMFFDFTCDSPCIFIT